MSRPPKKAIEQMSSAQIDLPDTNVGDTISRQAAIDALIELSVQRDAWDSQEGFAQKRGIDASICAIEDLPSVERRGRWKQVGDNTYRCSACGEISCCKSVFCGDCGADMREAKNGCDDCFIPMFYNLEDDDSICRDCGAGE